jgi:hypothetical protein
VPAHGTGRFLQRKAKEYAFLVSESRGLVNGFVAVPDPPSRHHLPLGKAAIILAMRERIVKLWSNLHEEKEVKGMEMPSELIRKEIYGGAG